MFKSLSPPALVFVYLFIMLQRFSFIWSAVTLFTVCVFKNASGLSSRADEKQSVHFPQVPLSSHPMILLFIQGLLVLADLATFICGCP